MSKRGWVVIIVLGLLAVAGAVHSFYWTPETVSAAEDCETAPPPKEEFAMAAECDAPAPSDMPAAPGQGGQ